VLDTCRPRYTWIAPCLAPNVLCWSRIAPRSTLTALRRTQIALRSTLAFRTVRGLLRDSDCSAPRFAPRSTLGASRCSRFAPRFGLLRSTARSALNTYRSVSFRIAPRHGLRRARYFTFRPAHGLLRARRFAPCTDHGLLRVQHFDLRTVQGLLPARHLTLRTFSDCSASRLAPRLVLCAPAPFPSRSVFRIAPLHVSLRARRLAFRAEPVSLRVSDCSAPRLAPRSSLPALCWSRIAPRSTLRVPHRSRIAPCSTLDARCQDTDRSVFDTFRFAPYSDCSEFWVSPLHGLRRARYLAFLVELGLLLARHLAPCVEPGLLRAQHLVLPDGAFRYNLQNRHC